MTDTLRQKLDPAVLALVESGRLHEFDAEWIANLQRKSQWAAAMKCLKGDLNITNGGRTFKGKGTCYL